MDDVYAQLAIKFKPNKIKIVLLAESPPAMSDNVDIGEVKYFYNTECVSGSLLLETAKVILDNNELAIRKKEDKISVLNILKNEGIFLVDAVKYPINKTDGKKAKKSFKNKTIKNSLPKLIDELKELNPQYIIIILSSIYDKFSQDLRDAALPIVNVRVRSPWYNPEIYKNELKQALKLCD